MQNLPALAGARGRMWRVERVETFRRTGGARLLHLWHADAGGGRAAIVVRPHEPVAHTRQPDGLSPVAAAYAAAAAVRAKRGERSAFTLPAAERLRGDIHAWQLTPALALERGHARVLVADAAGMGKTASAGIAIAACLDEGSDRRCLVLAPAHLLTQWRGELRDRLRIDATILEAASLRRLQDDIPAGVSAWSLPGCLLASLDFFKQPHILRSIDTTLWDLLVVDEAHMASGASDRHAAVDLVARRARRLLLLTATPSDGGDERMRELWSLGRHAGDAPLVCLRHVAAGRARAERTLLVSPGPPLRALHDELGAYTQWIAAAPRGEGPVPLLCAVLIKRALSSAHALHVSLCRRHALLGTAPSVVQPSLFDADEDPGVLGAPTGLPVDRERRRLAALIDLAARAADDDRRLRALATLVRRGREPAVIFSCFRDTAALLASRLSPDVRVRMIHGALPAAAIEAAIEAFTEGNVDVLVATDVASQGLNLHPRCRWVIHYDLPWRPPSIEQRTGRVDRLGQPRAVHATFLLDRSPLSAGMRARLSALTARMHEEERVGSRRWDVLAAAEAHRLRMLRGECAPAQAVALREGPITVVEIECAGASGAPIDRQVIALAANADAANVWARWFAARRQRRLQRALAVRAARRCVRERSAVDDALDAIGSPLRQDGLFERRAERNRASDGAARARLVTASREAIARHQSESRITAVRVQPIASFVIGGQASVRESAPPQASAREVAPQA